MCFLCCSFRFQSFESYDSRPCLPEHNPYRPSYSYDYDFDLGPDRNGGFGGQYSDFRDPARERGALDGFMRGRGQGRFQDRSNPSTFMRGDPFMPPAASSEPLSTPWTEMNYVGGRGLGGPSPGRPPPPSSPSPWPLPGMMGMQGAGGYDNPVPCGCGRSQTRIRDQPRRRGFNRCGPESLGRKRKQLRIYDEPDTKQARADSEGEFSENGMPWGQEARVGIGWVSCTFGAVPACLDSAHRGTQGRITRTPTVPL